MQVLITGAASGIGRATAELLLQNGHRVYGIDVQSAQGKFPIYCADITREDQLLAVKEQLQDVRLDAIINVAGIHKMVSLVESDYDQMKKVVDVNLTGTMLINRVFHSLLAPKGRIVIVTSEVAGFDPMPFNGLYNVTKTALDTYAQALRQELNLLGQKVVTVRPGAVGTDLCRGSVAATRALADTTELYQKQAKNFSAIAAKFMGKPISPEILAKLMYKAATKRRPKLTYKKHRNIGLVLLNLLPKRWQCGLIKFLLHLNFK